jgi:hypothetical protein
MFTILSSFLTIACWFAFKCCSYRGSDHFLPTFGQQTQASYEGRQIWSSFYSCWGTKATKSPCYEHLNFEQTHPKQKQNEKKAFN